MRTGRTFLDSVDSSPECSLPGSLRANPPALRECGRQESGLHQILDNSGCEGSRQNSLDSGQSRSQGEGSSGLRGWGEGIRTYCKHNKMTRAAENLDKPVNTIAVISRPEQFRDTVRPGCGGRSLRRSQPPGLQVMPRSPGREQRERPPPGPAGQAKRRVAPRPSPRLQPQPSVRSPLRAPPHREPTPTRNQMPSSGPRNWIPRGYFRVCIGTGRSGRLYDLPSRAGVVTTPPPASGSRSRLAARHLPPHVPSLCGRVGLCPSRGPSTETACCHALPLRGTRLRGQEHRAQPDCTAWRPRKNRVGRRRR